MMLHGPEIPAQHIGAGGFAKPAALQIQQQFQFVWCKSVTPYRAGDNFLNQLTERRQVKTFRSCISHG